MATRRHAISAASESAQLAHSARPNISVLNASELSGVNVQLLQGQHGQTHACDAGIPSDLVLRANNRKHTRLACIPYCTLMPACNQTNTRATRMLLFPQAGD